MSWPQTLSIVEAPPWSVLWGFLVSGALGWLMHCSSRRLSSEMISLLIKVSAAGLLGATVVFVIDTPPSAWNSYGEILRRFETVIKVAAPPGVLLGLYITWRRSLAHEKLARTAETQARTAEQGQITGRFTTAVEQLADERLRVRLGGIYALERIADDSDDRDHKVVMEVLCAFIREMRIPEEGKEDLGAQELDVQAEHSGIGRRKKFPSGETIDLRRANLLGALLEEAQLSGAQLSGVNLRLANLREANLRGADLRTADLKGASLRGADLRGSNLERADLRGADLRGADLRGADLRGARYLMDDLFLETTGNFETKLPLGLEHPSHWANHSDNAPG